MTTGTIPPEPLETLSDAGDALAASLSSLMDWAQERGLNCKPEREAIDAWCRVNEETLANATRSFPHSG